MNLKEIISIQGKGGLYKLISQTRSGVIVEDIETKQRVAVSAAKGVSSLGEIAMYTQAEELPLQEIIRRIAEKEDEKEITFKTGDKKEFLAYFEQIVPDFDGERVYLSHIEKLFKWYNLLAKAALVSKEVQQEDEK